MKIKFIGATGGDVTGSCILCCAHNGVQFLVDCGGYQGGRLLETKNARFPFDPKAIDFVLLTHAHFDHCGRIPMLYDLGFKGKVICNKATRDLAILNLMSGEKQKGWEKYSEKHSEKHRKAFFRKKTEMLSDEERKKRESKQWKMLSDEERREIFRRDDAWKREWEKLFREEWEESAGKKLAEYVRNQWEKRFLIDKDIPEIAHNGKRFFVDADLQITLLRSSHFLGATSFMVGWNLYKDGSGEYQSKDICFSGDLGGVIDDEENNHLTLLKDGMVPFVSTDYIVMESTYGATERDGEHKDFDNRIKHLKSLLKNEEVDDFVFACFSMQRTQDVLFDLIYLAISEEGCRFNITLDSPMGIEACRIYSHFLQKTRKKRGEEGFEFLNQKFVDRFFPLLENIGYTKDISDSCDVKIHTVRKFIAAVLDGRFSCPSVAVLFKSRENRLEDAKDICITSSGMFQDGPILKHILKKHSRERAAFVITGYCASTNNGRVLSTWIKEGEEQEDGQKDWSLVIKKAEGEEKIPKEKWKAKICSVASYYSGHADADSLLRFLFYSKKPPKEEDLKKETTAFLVHGNKVSREGLRKKIEDECKRFKNLRVREISSVELPNATSPFYDLDEGKWCPEDAQQQFFTCFLPNEDSE